MYQEITRGLNKLERKVLLSSIETTELTVSAKGTVKWLLVWGGCLAVIVVLSLGIIWLKPHPVSGGIVGGALVVAGIVCIYAIIALGSSYFHWGKVSRSFERETIPLIRRTLDIGKVLSKDITASSVIEIEECEDEGSGYIIAIGGGKSLLLKGQRYFPVEDEMPWPASTFSIVRSADKAVWIGVFSSGQYLSPIHKVKMKECIDDFTFSEREDVLNGEPEDILKSILVK